MFKLSAPALKALVVLPRHSSTRAYSVYERFHKRGMSQAASTTTPAPVRQLDWDAGPLVWIDCEMTGLQPEQDKILEIAVLITNGELEILDDGIQFVVQTEREALDQMNEWCVKQHGSSGLTQACIDSPHTLEHVEQSVLKYIKDRVPKQSTACLAGNSVHVDRAFLNAHMPTITDWLHYRIIDVSTIKELCRRWYPQVVTEKKDISHRALDDIRSSIDQLRWYRENVFRDKSTMPGNAQ